jgi:protein ImuB
LVPWGDERRDAERRDAEEPGGVAGEPVAPHLRPWPGRLPAPSPTTVLARPAPVEVLDGSGRPVRIDERQLIGAAPAWVLVGGGRARPVAGWAGPWPVDQRWWDAEAGWRGCRLQVVLDGGTDDNPDRAEEALLLVCLEGGRWSLVGRYD